MALRDGYTGGGAFTDATRAAIYEVGSGRCIGCGRTDLSAQHRDARGLGGTSNRAIGSPANGVPLCGDGTRGSHGWTESNPEWAELLGWRLGPGFDAEQTPFWTRYGWRRWHIEDDGFPSILLVDDDDLDRTDLRRQAIATYLAAVAKREVRTWAPARTRIA